MRFIVNKVCVITLFMIISLGTAEGMRFGIKAGMNIADMQDHSPVDTDSRIGFCGGGFLSLGLGDIFVIQPEVLYTQKGVKWDIVPIWRELGQVTYYLNYVEIPILFKVVLPIKGVVKPNLFLGPYFARNINGTYKMETSVTSEEFDYDEFTKDADRGIVMGGGVDFLLKKGKIVLDGRYALGWITTSEYGLDDKNSVVSFMLGYSF